MNQINSWMRAREALKEGAKQAAEIVRKKGLRHPSAGSQQFINDLQSSDPERRTTAASFLGALAIENCSEELLEILLPKIYDPHKGVRISICVVFGACGYSPAVDGLIRMLMSDDVAEIGAAGFSLCAIGESAVPALVKVITSSVNQLLSKSRTSPTRAHQEAVQALNSMGPDLVNWLIDGFFDIKSEDDWYLICAILAKFPEQAQDALDRVVKAANLSRDEQFRNTSIMRVIETRKNILYFLSEDDPS